MNRFIIFLVVICAISFSLWYSMANWFAAPDKFGEAGTWFTPFFLLAALTAIVSLAFLLPGKRAEKEIYALAQLGAFLVFFHNHILYLGAAALFLLLQYIGLHTFDRELKERMKINVLQFVRRGGIYVLASFLILTSFAYYMSPNVQELAQSKKLPSSFHRVVGTVVSQFFSQTEITPQEKKEVESGIVLELERTLSPYFRFLPPIMAFSMFLILYSLSFLFIWISVYISVFLFWILKKSGMVKIEKVQREAEIIAV